MATEYTRKAKQLDIGSCLIMEKKYYDSIVTTNTRLKRNGKGEFSIKTVDDNIIVTRLK